MPSVVRLPDFVITHGWTPQVYLAGSVTVLVNNLPVIRMGDPLSVHSSYSIPPVVHAGAVAVGSTSVLVEGRPVTRIGDAIPCGSVAGGGSANVIAS